MTEQQKDEFFSNFDYFAATEEDGEVMNAIAEFLNKLIKFQELSYGKRVFFMRLFQGILLQNILRILQRKIRAVGSQRFDGYPLGKGGVRADGKRDSQTF